MYQRESGEYAAGGGVFECKYDDFFTLVHAEDSLFGLLKYTRKEFENLYHNHILEVIYEEDRALILAEIKRQLAHGNVFVYENRLKVKGGNLLWVWISAELIKDEKTGDRFHCIYHDISKAKEAQEQLAVSEKRYDIVLSHVQDIIFELDCGTFEIYYSPNFEKKFGYRIPPDGFPDSMFATDIIYESDKPGLRDRFQSILRGGDSMECEYRIKSADGCYIWVDVHATALRDSTGRLLKILGIISDIDQRKREILKAQMDAISDPLTGLLNRRECVAVIEQYMAQNRSKAAFFLIDVDNFKKINDTYGHLYGDTILKKFAENLRVIFRRDDVVGRIGGDEFIVFMKEPESQNSVKAKAADIQHIFHHFSPEIKESSVGCSIGISFYPVDGSDFRSLFAKADTAMYQAKNGGKSRCCIYGEVRGIAEPESLSPPHRIMQKSFHDHILETAFQILLDHPESNQAVSMIFELIGRVFNIDYIYIFEKAESGDFFTRYQWRGEGHLLQRIR